MIEFIRCHHKGIVNFFSLRAESRILFFPIYWVKRLFIRSFWFNDVKHIYDRIENVKWWGWLIFFWSCFFLLFSFFFLKSEHAHQHHHHHRHRTGPIQLFRESKSIQQFRLYPQHQFIFSLARSPSLSLSLLLCHTFSRSFLSQYRLRLSFLLVTITILSVFCLTKW